MLRGHLNSWRKGIEYREPVARFLKSYAIFISDHTGKEDKFFDLVDTPLDDIVNYIAFPFAQCLSGSSQLSTIKKKPVVSGC
jgi:hypothetical protein